jgi:hypothetical protein
MTMRVRRDEQPDGQRLRQTALAVKPPDSLDARDRARRVQRGCGLGTGGMRIARRAKYRPGALRQQR